MRWEDNGGVKYWLLQFGLLLSMGILAVSFLKINLVRGSYYSTLSWANKVEEIRIPAARGQIVDRKGRVLVKSVFDYGSSWGEFDGYRFEGKEIGFKIKRQYTFAESMGVITGYVGRVNEKELENKKCGSSLHGDSLVGRGGVEEVFDCQLRGTEGRRLIEVDAKGKFVRELGMQKPVDGSNLELAIDGFWQEKVYQLLQGKKATVVISEPATGKIRVLVSSPGFDANAFGSNQDNTKIKSYLEDKENLPLLNRAIGARYHPGSVFKLVMATAGLQSGQIDRGTLIEDTGVIKIGDYSFNNWLWTKRGATDGMVDVVKALKRSNDIYFYKLGEMMGVETIKDWAGKFGYGVKTGVELPAEVGGINPDNNWKKENKGERWYLGDTYHLSIGQGFLGATPLQVNLSTNIIANNGVRCRMSILKNSRQDCEMLGIRPATIEAVRQGMMEACQTGGTAYPLFNFKTRLACKTGTAEVGDGSKDTHAWLTAFAPALDPEISITVMVERGGEGSDMAAPIVGDILKEWFNEPETVVPRLTPKIESE